MSYSSVDVPAAAVPAARDARAWAQLLVPYRDPSVPRSFAEIAITILPFFALWAAMWFLMGFSYWLALPLAIPAAGFLVRTFLILHDCGHGAFFKSRALNDWVGRLCGVLTLTPFGVWRKTHNMHHATSGNLDRRGLGDIETMTVAEYNASPWYERLRYRAYRHPITLFLIGPAFVFFLSNRLPVGLMDGGWRPWFSAMMNNLAIAAIVAGMMYLVGWSEFLLIEIPILLLASSMGIWLFFVQHQFEDTVWADGEKWDLQHAALKGSSHYDLPIVLRWFTANIGVHHVHHLSSRIPYYRLQKVLRDHPELRDVGRLTLWKSFSCVRLALWDEVKGQLVSFRDLRRPAMQPA